jgi:threonine aldolase
VVAPTSLPHGRSAFPGAESRNGTGTIESVSDIVDLRSDTVTRPTQAMRHAMAAAEVGDDGYGEDPTVNALEELVADRLGMEAALFVPSGTMANQIALRVLGRPGTTVIAGRRQHLVAYEVGAAGLNSAVQLAPVDDTEGIIDPADVVWAREGADNHLPTPSVVAIENSHMASGGRVWSVESWKALRTVAGDLAIHVDGARIFNAEVASGVPVAHMVEGASTAMVSLSKGLCAPVGSLLAGSSSIVAQARVERRRLGGAMRQAGVIAAAGLVAVQSMVERLAEDHERARRLAIAVAARWPNCGLDPESVITNLVVFIHSDPPVLLDYLRAAGVLAGTIAPGTVRLATHHDVDDVGIDRTVAALAGAPG